MTHIKDVLKDISLDTTMEGVMCKDKDPYEDVRERMDDIVRQNVEEAKISMSNFRRHFEIIEEYQGVIDATHLPRRGTLESAGYDFKSAEDIIIPSLMSEVLHMFKNPSQTNWEVRPDNEGAMDLSNIKDWLKSNKTFKPVLVPTGIKAIMPSNEYLSLDNRSSIPLNSFLMVANSRGIIDADYKDADNGGHIHVMLYNLSPYPIRIRKGDKIAQGIFHKYQITTDDDPITKKRVGGFGSTGRK